MAHNEKDRPLKIAFIGARGIGSAYSGIETYYEELGSRLVTYGHEVLVYCRRHATPEGVDFKGITPIFRPCVRTKHGETFSHTLISSLDVLFRSVDIVQFHALGPALFAGIPRLRGMRTVNSIRGLDWQREKWGGFATSFLQFCERQSYRMPNRTAVVSKTLKQHYKDAYGADVTFIPNGVTMTETPEPQEIKKLGLEGKDYILYMGRLSPEKGLDVLLKAYESVADRAKLVIAGGSSYTDGYMEELRRLAPDDVIFPGKVGGRLKSELYGNSLAYILPSTIEGLSVALLEAMSFGTCVVTSDIEPNLELSEGVGMNFPTGDVAQLADRLRRVVDCPEEREEMGRLARARVEAEYTWDAVARKTEAFYYDLLASPQGARAGAMAPDPAA